MTARRVGAAHEREKARFAQRLFTDAARGYDMVSEALSLGQYQVWQSKLVESARSCGIHADSEVLDVATGTGKIARELIARTGCRVVGLDLTRAMLAGGARRFDEGTLQRHRGLVQASADSLPFPDARFDGLTFSYLYRYVSDPLATTRELVRVVKPGGFVGFIEFHVPPAPLWNALWRMHTRVALPAAAALAGPGWFRVGRFLGPDIESFYREWDVPRLGRMLEDAGLANVQHRVLSLGGGLVQWGTKR